MFRRFASYLGPYKKYGILASLCIVLETVFELIIPLVMSDIIDVGVVNQDRAYILGKGMQMLVFALTALVLGVGSAKFAAVCGYGLGAEIRKAEYQKLQSFSFSNIDHFTTPSLVTRLTSDITTIQNSVATGLRPAFRAPVMMVTSLVVAFFINARLALVFVVAIPALGTLLWQIICHVRPVYSRMQRAYDLVNRIVQENLTAIRVVKAYVRGEYETEKFREVNENLRTVSERAFAIAAFNMPAMQFVMYATILAILWFGGNLIFTGGMEVGKLTGFLSYVLQVLNSLMMLSGVFMTLTRSLASGKRILEILDEEIDITDENAKEVTVKEGNISFRHVYFKYQADAKEYVLSDISLDIRAGQTVGIIGETGAAKSTLVQLIPRLYDITSGELLIDGIPVTEYRAEHLREAVAMVLQKNTLFSGTVKENLRWGKEGATDEEIERACHTACVDEFIGRLPKGYDTELGQGGVNLSGGQKQRLCIARAILKSPKILIFDDSTSAVDTATEADIRRGLSEDLKDTTKIIIAQRISSVCHADQIVILEHGRIHALGTHEELLGRSAVYQEIYQSQKEGAEL